jgi:hypothetical protein
MSVCCECCMLSGIGLCDVLIPRPEEFYRVLCVWLRSWIFDNEVALSHWGLLQRGKINKKRNSISPFLVFNPLKPNDAYIRRTAPLTSKRCILYIYSTNISTEYFKHGIYSPFFPSSKCSLFHNSNLFGSCIIHILYIYSTNISTEYFKHGIYSPFFPSSKCSLFHNSNYFVPVLFTFYIFI